jgi:hypothetical protein
VIYEVPKRGKAWRSTKETGITEKYKESKANRESL